MSNKYDFYINDLSNPNMNERLNSLIKLMQGIKLGEIERPVKGGYVNNHIHTTYSFSPYSPAKAVWMAYQYGLTTAGIMDHDSINGAREFIEAGKIAGMATTIGFECRVDFSGTPLKGKRLNNTDQDSIAYITLHGIPHTQIDKVKEYLSPFTVERNKRNAQMVERINILLKPINITISFETDVVPLSQKQDGGSITERHLLFAVSKKLIDKLGKGEALVGFLKEDLKLPLNNKIQNLLLDVNNPHYEYDLLGVLKSDLLEKFYINATTECPDVREVIKLSESIGAISAYAYLGDVVNSVTGDKKAQKFEDDYLEELFNLLKDLGFRAVTYMPSRNTIEQLKRLKGLCDKHGFFQISGEDINSPRQSFVCEALANPEFKNLIDATWALIGHEKAATKDLSQGFFSKETEEKWPNLEDRIKNFKNIGLE